jgi:hypothetical protein
MSQNVESHSNESVESLREPAENCSSHLQYKQNLYIKLWKKSDGQQFHQLIEYQQNELSPLILTHWTQWKTMTYVVGNPCPGLLETGSKMW